MWRIMLALGLLQACSHSSKGSTAGTSSGASGGTTGGGASSGANGGAAGGGGSQLPASANQVAAGRASPGGKASDAYTWFDADGHPREADFVDDTYPGGYIRQLTYQLPDGTTRTVAGGVGDYDGFGYLVCHYDVLIDAVNDSGSDSDDSNQHPGVGKTLWVGRHHLMREYKVTMHPPARAGGAAGAVDATVRWLMATGRSSLLFSVTFNTTSAPSVIMADSRGPYGVVAWDGTANGSAELSGVGWGDEYQFATTGAEVNLKSGWTYQQPNTIPYNLSFVTGHDAEMGMVATQTFSQGISGEDVGTGNPDLANSEIDGSNWVNTYCWNQTSLTAVSCANTDTAMNGGDGVGAVMPWTSAWPYQMSNYNFNADFSASTNKKMAWGSNYGVLGFKTTKSFDRTLHTYPFASYAVNVVLDRHSDGGVMAEVANQEATQATTITATQGSVATSGPAGIARVDTMTYVPPGWDPFYGVWRVSPDASGVVALSLTSSATLVHPIFVVSQALAAPSVTVDGHVLTADVDFFASTDTDGKTGSASTWVTLNRQFTGAHTITVH